VNGWTEAIAESILNGIVKVIQKGVKVAQAMSDAIDRAESRAWESAKEHPVYTALIAAGTIIALGVLVMLAPYVLETLGFEALGPRAGDSESEHEQDADADVKL
jgi:gamma-glutamyltranspeptidase/glutathione hydrolase